LRARAGADWRRRSAIIAGGSALAQSGDVNVYTYRESKLIQPLFDAFTKDTGIKVNVISASSGLEQRIKTEGANSPADVLLTVDIGRLEDAVRSGITQPIKSDVLDKVVAPQYRDPEGHWYGISMRARVAYASKDRVPQTALTYEELADPKWKGKICIRSGQHIYNNALFAAYIGHHGEAKDRGMAQGPQGQSRAEALGRRPRNRTRHRSRQVRHRHRQHLLLGADEQQRAGQEGVGRRHEGHPADVPGRRHPCEHFGCRARQECAEQSQCDEVHRVDGEREGATHARRPQLRISRPHGDRGQSTIAGYGKLNADPIPISKIADNKKAAANLVDKVGFDN
jgi:iron(III) transport system substrate-binding protein